jgi:hypothetical protein
VLDGTARIFDLMLQFQVDRTQPQASNHLRMQGAQERVCKLEDLQGLRFPANGQIVVNVKLTPGRIVRFRSASNIKLSGKTILSRRKFFARHAIRVESPTSISDVKRQVNGRFGRLWHFFLQMYTEEGAPDAVFHQE